MTDEAQSPCWLRWDGGSSPWVNEIHGMGSSDAPEPADEPEGVKPQVNAGTSRRKVCFQQNGTDGDG